MSKPVIFISHSSDDSDLCGAFAELVEECSLHQIETWHSSDLRGSRGMQPGSRWFDQIKAKLDEATAAVILCTPKGVKSDWVIFEAGYGASVADLEILPVTVGLTDITDVPTPFSHWQTFDVSTADKCSNLLAKLFAKLGIHHDDKLIRERSSKFLSQVAGTKWSDDGESVDDQLEDKFSDIREYLDRKFFQFERYFEGVDTNYSGYYIEFINQIDLGEINIHIENDTNFGDVLDQIYFKIKPNVSVFSYLYEWVLYDTEYSQPLIVYEAGKYVPASSLIKPGSKIAIRRLNKPIRTGHLDMEGDDEP